MRGQRKIGKKICHFFTKKKLIFSFFQFLSSVPVEKCELEPYEVCSTVMKQYPTLVETENCEVVPRESCDPERVLPKIVVRPVVKKSCIKDDDNDKKEGPDTSLRKFPKKSVLPTFPILL